MFANINNLVEEVLQERNLGVVSVPERQESATKKSVSLFPDDEDFSLDGLVLNDRQRKAVKNVDMVNQLAIIKALREQQGVAKPKRTRLEEKRYADNAYAGVKSDSTNSQELGNLSSKHESNHNPRATGNDENGGHSYGRYQIETKHGTMFDYIKYLKSKPQYQEFATILNEAGGYEGAYAKTDDFVDAWNKLSSNKEFNDSQYQFILEKKLAPY